MSRRTVLVAGAAGAALLVFPACVTSPGGESGPSGGVDASDQRDGRFLTEDQYNTTRALMDALIPADETPGAAQAGVADYVDYLLGAFQVDPPRIFGAGPFSGRHGGDARFDVHVPLSRVQEIAWRTAIEGSRGLPEREFNGPVTGWQEIYTRGLAELDSVAASRHGSPFAELGFDARWDVIDQADAAFIDLASEHAVEGMYAAPEYGGNREMLGWKGIEYEGDRQPVGYTRRQMGDPDAGGDLSANELKAAERWLRTVLERRGTTIV